MTASKPNIRSRRANLLVQRLEHLSADSVWAHRASGVRASLDKALACGDSIDPAYLDLLIEQGFELLKKAAWEIPAHEL